MPDTDDGDNIVGAERKLTQRTYAGLKAARAGGRKGGRKPKLDARQVKGFKALLRGPDIRVTGVADKYDVSRATLFKHAGVVNPVRTMIEGN